MTALRVCLTDNRLNATTPNQCDLLLVFVSYGGYAKPPSVWITNTVTSSLVLLFFPEVLHVDRQWCGGGWKAWVKRKECSWPFFYFTYVVGKSCIFWCLPQWRFGLDLYSCLALIAYALSSCQNSLHTEELFVKAVIRQFIHNLCFSACTVCKRWVFVDAFLADYYWDISHCPKHTLTQVSAPLFYLITKWASQGQTLLSLSSSHPVWQLLLLGNRV